MLNDQSPHSRRFVTPAFLRKRDSASRRFRSSSTSSTAALQDGQLGGDGILLRAMKKNRRRLKFEQWICWRRAALVLVLVGDGAGAADGMQGSALARIAGQRSALHVIVIDNSYSMAYEAAGRCADASRSRQEAREGADRHVPGGRGIGRAGDGAKPAAGGAGGADVRPQPRAMPSIACSNPSAGPICSARCARAGHRAEGKVADGEDLYVIDDATRSAWQTPDAEAIASSRRSSPSVSHHATSTSAARTSGTRRRCRSRRGNLVTNRLENSMLATRAIVRQRPGCAAAVAAGRCDPPRRRAGAFTGEPQVFPQAARSSARRAARRTAQLVGDDRLKIDNTRYRVVDVASELKVLIVEGERGMSSSAGPGVTRTRLAPPKRSADEPRAGTRSDSYVSPEVVSDWSWATRCSPITARSSSPGRQIPAQADQLALFVKKAGR
jgi:hypothetical protein